MTERIVHCIFIHDQEIHYKKNIRSGYTKCTNRNVHRKDSTEKQQQSLY